MWIEDSIKKTLEFCNIIIFCIIFFLVYTRVYLIYVSFIVVSNSLIWKEHFSWEEHTPSSSWRNIVTEEYVWEVFFSLFPLDLQEHVTLPFLRSLEAQWSIGKRVIDWWAWSSPLSLQIWWDHLSILVDRIKKDYLKDFSIMYDLRKLWDPFYSTENLSFFQEIDHIFDGEKADFMIFSDILNYVGGEEFLKQALTLLSPTGSLCIVNGPERWTPDLFASDRISTNEQLFSFLKNEGFSIQTKQLILWKELPRTWFAKSMEYHVFDYATSLCSEIKKDKETVLVYAVR